MIMCIVAKKLLMAKHQPPNQQKQSPKQRSLARQGKEDNLELK
jgi:hypothetical protein